MLNKQTVITLPDSNLLQWGFNLNRLSFYPCVFKEDLHTMVELSSYFVVLLNNIILGLPEFVLLKRSGLDLKENPPMFSIPIEEMLSSKKVIASMEKNREIMGDKLADEHFDNWKREIKDTSKWLSQMVKATGVKDGISKHLQSNIYYGHLKEAFHKEGLLERFEVIVENAVAVLDMFYQTWCLVKRTPQAGSNVLMGRIEIDNWDDSGRLYLYLTTFPESQAALDMQSIIIHDMNLWAEKNGFEIGSSNHDEHYSILYFCRTHNIFGYYYKKIDDIFTSDKIKGIIEDFKKSLEKSINDRLISFTDSDVIRTNKEGKKYIIIH